MLSSTFGKKNNALSLSWYFAIVCTLLCLCVSPVSSADDEDLNHELTLAMIPTLDTNKEIFARMAKIEQAMIQRNPNVTVEPCREHRFHPADFFALINNVIQREDCMVMCHKSDQCFRMAYSKTLKACYLFSNIINFMQLPFAEFEGLSSEMCMIGLFYRFKKKPNKEEIFSGPAPLADQCGNPHFPFSLTNAPYQRHKRIVNGQYPPYYSIPWAVSLRHINFVHFCTGSLVSSKDFPGVANFVLTAAHCLNGVGKIYENGKTVYAVAGMYDGRFKEAHEQVTTIAQNLLLLTKAKRKNEKNVPDTYDVALLVLKDPIMLNNYIRPLCLPKTKDEKIPDTDKCFVSGWGYSTVGNPAVAEELTTEESQVLLATKVEIFELPKMTTAAEEKPKQSKKSRKRPKQPDSDYTLFGAVKKEPPNGRQLDSGNSGAALFCLNDQGTFTAYGIANNVAVGFNEATHSYESTFDLYAKVAYLVHIIHSIMAGSKEYDAYIYVM